MAVQRSRLFTEVVLFQLAGSISFFQNDVPLAFASANDPRAKSEFAVSNAAVVKALQAYAEWLKTGVLPKSDGGSYRVRYWATQISSRPSECIPAQAEP